MMCLFALLSVLVLAHVVSAQISSVDNSITWTCPDRQVIDTAYFGYCPATDTSGASLNGILTYANYDQAPQSYLTSSASATPGFEIFCSYADNTLCHGTAGGSAPLTLEANAACRAFPAAVPAPSGGGTYRRRKSEKRATLGTRPLYVCPFTSTDSTIYSIGEQIESGSLATDPVTNAVLPAGTIHYACQTPGAQCFYVQNAAGLTFTGAQPANLASLCPQTLCAAIYNGSGNMRRGVFMESKAVLNKRQVRAKTLRDRAMGRSKTVRAIQGTD